MGAQRIVSLKDAVDAIFVGIPTHRLTEIASSDAVTGRIINIRDIQGDELPEDPRELSTIAVPRGTDWEKFRVQAGDVLITARSSVKVAPVREDYSGALAAANLIVVRPGETVAAPLVLAFLRHPETKQQLERLSTGTTVTSINVKAVSSLRIKIPTPEQQMKLASLSEASERSLRATMRAAEIRRRLAQQVLIKQLGAE